MPTAPAPISFAFPFDFHASLGLPPLNASKAPLTAQWEPGWDCASQRWYYQNRVHGTSSWERPSGCDVRLPSKPPSDVSSVPHYPGKVVLPRGWEEGWDSASSRHYYFNRVTEERQWAHPATTNLFKREKTTTQTDASDQRVEIGQSVADGSVMCKMGCGRHAAAGFTKGGNRYDTCCRGCATGGHHEATCRHSATHQSGGGSPTSPCSHQSGHADKGEQCMAEDGDLFCPPHVLLDEAQRAVCV